MLVLTLDSDNHARLQLPDGRSVLVKWLRNHERSRTRLAFEAPGDIKIVREGADGRLKSQGRAGAVQTKCVEQRA